MRYVCGVVAAGILGIPVVQAQPAALQPRALDVKYVRDSEEYSTLARQVYRLATERVRVAAQNHRDRWAVVLDLDETALDNSTYQLDRAAYGLPYDSASWNAWVVRRQAGAVPGVADFVATVRGLGGHVAWISNRDVVTREATRANLQQLGLWNDDDRLCLQANVQHTKRVRRAEVASGDGSCAWQGVQMSVVAFIGDQMGDFPDASEAFPGTGSDVAFGLSCFLLPNPMYGEWTSRVTRR
jgi:acid phosphatase